MVTAVTSFGRSGLYDWFFQRVSAVVMAAYTICLLGFILTTPELNYAVWKEFFDSLARRIFSLLTLLSVVGHAWIGLWAVLTDYITPRMMGGKATLLRVVIQLVLGVVMIVYIVWGIEIFWGL